MFKPTDIVRAPQGDGYADAIVTYAEPKQGFRRSYPYQSVDVEFEDGRKATFADFSLIATDTD